MKNNIAIRIEEKSEYREVENLVRDSFWNIILQKPGKLTAEESAHCPRDIFGVSAKDRQMRIDRSD